jgi:subtilase family serine protease
MILALPVGALASPASATPDRITSPVVSSVRTRTNGVHPLATKQNDLGRVGGAKVFRRMVLLLQGSDAQKSELAQLLKDQQNPKSAQYHKWLTPTQFGERFGPSDNDMAKVTGWLTGQGFSVEKPSNGRRFLLFTGTSAQVESAFQTEIHTYQVSGKSYFANAKPASIPTALSGVVKGVARMNGFNPAKPQITSNKKPQALVGGYVFTTPADLQAIYNSSPLNKAGLNGEGQSIAVIEQSNINLQDVTDFRNITNLPAAKLNIILNGPDPGIIGDESEALVDVDYAGAFVPNATLNFVVSASTDFNGGIDLSTVYAVDNLVSPITSLSYGGCETLDDTFGGATLYQYAWEQGAAEGISHFVSSGDNGGDSCGFIGLDTGFGVNALGSSPFNVSVGGTEFLIPTLTTYFPPPNYIATGYIPESAWNDYENPNDGRGLAGGGGVSVNYAKPDWQAGPGVPADGARDLPDVSLLAGDNLAYLLCERDIGADCSQGYGAGEIGTSLAAPSWASIQALVNQKNSIVNGAGNPNPTYYALAASSNSPFHDITVGDNKVPDSDGALVGYDTTPGYDLATGLGSVDVNKLALAWLTPTGTGTATVSLTADQTHITHGDTVNTLTTVTGGGSTAATGDFAIFAGAEAVGQGVVATSGGSSYTFSPAYGVLLPGGTYNLKAHYAGDANYAAADSNLVPITVDPEPTTTTEGVSTHTAIFGEPVTFSASTTGNNSGTGFTVGGVYTFSEGGKSLGTGSVAFTGESFNSLNYGASASLTFEGTTSLTAGTHTIIVSSPPASASFGASTSSAVSVTISKAPVIFSLQVDHTTPAVGSTINLNANVVADYTGNVPVTGNVDFYDGQTKIGTVVLGTKPNALGEFFATYTVTAITAGLHNYIAIYDGDANNYSNNSGSVNVTAGKSSTVTSLGNSTTDTLVLAGTSVALQANVAGDTANAAPSGTVTFTDTNAAAPVTVGTATVTAGVATLNISTLAEGRHNIIATYAGDANFTGSVSGVAIVRVADFTIAATPATASVIAGQTSSAVTLAYAIDYNIASYGGNPNVTFACSGLPSGATCNFTNTTVTPTVGSTGAVTASDTLTISTTGPTLTKASLDRSETPSHHGLGITLAGVLMLGLPLAFRRKRLLPVGFGLVALLFACCLSGCSGSSLTTYNASGGTPAGASTVTITATVTGGNGLGTVSHTATVALTVTSPVN